MPRPRSYDLALFLELNEEYAQKPVHKSPPPNQDQDAHRAYKVKVARGIGNRLRRHVKLDGKRVLDFGCGRGAVCAALAEEYGCKTMGVDVKRYPEWDTIDNPDVDLRVLDLSEDVNARKLKNHFDVIVSNSVLEHVVHPYHALQGMRTVLKPKGIVWLKANLYRGPLASHRYRDVFFPWPHLLFTDEVFAQFYERSIGRPRTPAWVNKLTALHYRFYFDKIGFDVLQETFSTLPFDEAFYARFEDVLGRYPRFDLERDFINVILRPR